MTDIDKDSPEFLTPHYVLRMDGKERTTIDYDITPDKASAQALAIIRASQTAGENRRFLIVPSTIYLN